MSLAQPPIDALAITALVITALERRGVPYALVGSLASSLHGLPRSTNDADIVVDLPGSAVEWLVAELTDDFYIDGESVHRAIARSSHFNVIHLATMFKIDVFVVGGEPTARAQLDRASRITAGDTVLVVASAEDTIARKLRWYRDGGEVSERQWSDVLGMIQLQRGRLDSELLDRLAEELEVIDLLEQARATLA